MKLQDTLVQVLQILLKSKLLITEDDENDLQPTSQLSLFLGYKKYATLLLLLPTFSDQIYRPGYILEHEVKSQTSDML